MARGWLVGGPWGLVGGRERRWGFVDARGGPWAPVGARGWPVDGPWVARGSRGWPVGAVGAPLARWGLVGGF